jgi:uncharacterized coiled-coil protein SlyX
MSNPIVHAFFLGKAVAEVLQEQAARTMSEVLSEIGKFDAEQRVHLRQFTEQVQERAQSAADQAATGRTGFDANGSQPYATPSSQPNSVDLQATLDNLRAEIARLRAELKQHRTPS